eukprot:TRINITY_DN67_c2_g1_i1.p1 TRINITY_DN67_c2_g1~~TRINITY_DN67_c2_g1_i1.p1  ORF type:complete len:1571 (-),score=243.24 TRINITY_DN67_c2_g1_i1:172-4884(-)
MVCEPLPMLYAFLILTSMHKAIAAPRSDENAKWNVNFETNHVPRDYRGEWTGHKYFPSPSDWRSLSIYQLITDRFADGDPRNNDAGFGGFDVRDMTFRHGGDFAGLKDRLHYIKGLGCTAVWISPIFQNGFNSYHMYAQHDFTLLDRRLGTLDELRELTSAAHELGMYIIVDVVMNHMANELYFEGHKDKYAPFKFHTGEYTLAPRHDKDLYDTPAGKQPYIDFWYNNTWDPEARYGCVYSRRGEEVCDPGNGSFSHSDFHHNGDLGDYWDAWQIHHGKIYGIMDDLRLEQERVQEKYIAMTKALITSADIDGFRVDTPMQVPLSFFKKWAPSIREHARLLGKDRFGLFGEFFVAPERFATMTGRGKDQTMYSLKHLETIQLARPGGCRTASRDECCRYIDGQLNSPYSGQVCVPASSGKLFRSGSECEPLCWVEGTCGDSSEPDASASTCTTTTTTTTRAGVFTGVDGGSDRACRGADASDNSISYFTLASGVDALDDCKNMCLHNQACVGIEFKAGRCEIWTRPDGIQATVAVSGYTCLRLSMFPQPTGEFTLVDGADRACRGANTSDNLASYYIAVSGVDTLNTCKDLCMDDLRCVGIEFRNGRCEIWTREDGIQSTVSVAGYTCFHYKATRALPGGPVIEGSFTLKGGINYNIYWYMLTALVQGKPEYADGFNLGYKAEAEMLDTFDPDTMRSEYAMWNFCNNHDQWRLQVLKGSDQLRLCLAVISFFPGVPLHYAGDEQDFNTPGTALDGWAREELSVSLAWRAARTSSSGNPADRDSFDMTSSSYLYIQRLNAIRRAYFSTLDNEACDTLTVPKQHTLGALIFFRGCSADKQVAVVANFNTAPMMLAVSTPWSNGTNLCNALSGKRDQVKVTIGLEGLMSVLIAPISALVLVECPVSIVPPSVVAVSPGHGQVADWHVFNRSLNVTLSFDRGMDTAVAAATKFDGEAGKFQCVSADCQQIFATLDRGEVEDGIHAIELHEAHAKDGSAIFAPFRSTFVVSGIQGVIAKPGVFEHPGLICSFTALCHHANSARYLRIKNVGGSWSQWQEYTYITPWTVQPGVAVLIQYHAEGSSSYIAGDCLYADGTRCYSSWHKDMFLRGDWNGWGAPNISQKMSLVDHFTWAFNITFSGFSRAKFVPFADWRKTYGLHPSNKFYYGLPAFDPRSKVFQAAPKPSGTEASRDWLQQQGDWAGNESITSSAPFATHLWLSDTCTPNPPPCEIIPNPEWRCWGFREGQDQQWCRTVGTNGCDEIASNDGSANMSSCGHCSCCARHINPDISGSGTEQKTCCVLFNDLFLNFSLTDNMQKCAPAELEPLPKQFQAVDGGYNRSCRGASVDDDSTSYYISYNGIAALDVCKMVCIDTPNCTGIEYHSNSSNDQCRVWIRAEGIGASVEAPGSSCFLYSQPNISVETTTTTTTTTTTATTTTTTTTTNTTATTTTTTATTTTTISHTSLFTPVDGGVDRACRGENETDNQPNHYIVYTGMDALQDCKSVCSASLNCVGIEYSPGRCELWTRAEGIESSIRLTGYTCLRYNSSAAANVQLDNLQLLDSPVPTKRVVQVSA